MKIYRFGSYGDWFGSYEGMENKLYTVRELDAEEKPKTYCGDGFRISKDDIGVLDSWGKMYLLENNPKQYLDAILERQLKKVARLNAEIDSAKKYADLIQTVLDGMKQ